MIFGVFIINGDFAGFLYKQKKNGEKIAYMSKLMTPLKTYLLLLNKLEHKLKQKCDQAIHIYLILNFVCKTIRSRKLKFLMLLLIFKCIQDFYQIVRFVHIYIEP